jgi:hypothetical protein
MLQYMLSVYADEGMIPTIMRGTSFTTTRPPSPRRSPWQRSCQNRPESRTTPFLPGRSSPTGERPADRGADAQHVEEVRRDARASNADRGLSYLRRCEVAVIELPGRDPYEGVSVRRPLPKQRQIGYFSAPAKEVAAVSGISRINIPAMPR